MEIEEIKNIEIESPEQRRFLIDTLKALGDKEEQKKWFGIRYNILFSEDIKKGTKKAAPWDTWVESQSPNSFWNNLEAEIEQFDNLLLTDILFNFEEGFQPGPNQEKYTLFNLKEVETVMNAVHALELVCKEIGLEKSGEAYLNSPLWQEVINKSQKAYNFLIENNKKYNLDLRFSWEKEEHNEKEDFN